MRFFLFCLRQVILFFVEYYRRIKESPSKTVVFFFYSILLGFRQLNGEGLLMIVRLAYMPRAVLNNVYRVSRSLLLASF